MHVSFQVSGNHVETAEVKVRQVGISPDTFWAVNISRGMGGVELFFKSADDASLFALKIIGYIQLEEMEASSQCHQIEE